MKASFRIWAALLALLFSTSGFALNMSPSLRMVGDMSRFLADIQLAMFEPENTEFHQDAQNAWKKLQQSYSAWLPSVDNLQQRKEVEAAWAELRSAAVGDSAYQGLLIIGYDSTLSGRLTLAMDTLRRVLFARPEMSPERLTALEWLWVQSYRHLASYMLVAAAPFGSFALSADDGEVNQDARIEETDEAWQRAIREASGDQRNTLVRAHRRWQFIRETLLQATQRSLPYIVNVQMNGILQDIESLMGAAASNTVPGAVGGELAMGSLAKRGSDT